MNTKQPIGKREIEQAAVILRRYKDGKQHLENRIVEEERWWKLRHWDIIREDGQSDRPEPTSAWLFNSIANKHADVMDSFPDASVLPREEGDVQDAQILSSILPVIFESRGYEKTYSDAIWYKLKHGAAAKGVFWNHTLENGMGDIDITLIDLLNIFWEPGITDLQDSRNLFIVTLRDNDLLEQEYPDLKGKLGGKVIDVKQYVYDDQVDVSDKSVVVDWYYKKRIPTGRTILHYCKFVGSEVLYASENDPACAERGFYDHGTYPVTLDVLFPEEGTPAGFGYISVMKSPQMYIDKLSQVILENTVKSATPRWYAKKNVGINLEQYMDWSCPIVEVEGDISEERLRPIEVAPVSAGVLNILRMKIDELKETSSNRDVSQGSSSGGVTAAAAIAALQEAGSKTSRDMIAGSYRSYTAECYLVIELIRQFYDEMRAFRITGERGEQSFVRYSNAALQGQPIAPAYPGQETEQGYTPAVRRPIFDVVVRAHKRSPYSRMAQNELAKEMYRLGFFNPKFAEQTLTALELMEFDGDTKVRERVQQGQTLQTQMRQMQRDMQRMCELVEKITGEKSTAQAPAQMQEVPPRQSVPPAGKRLDPSQDYAREVASRAVPEGSR
ncbi:MAG: hypothetical protein IJ955_05430 [Oscillospiraceae bacterium]|nr:hypothetical protein [Oscillospiraceae bacterium]